jgi:hypothetical protein
MPMRQRTRRGDGPGPRQWWLLIETVSEAHEARQTFDRICHQSSIPAATAGRIAAALQEIWTAITPSGDSAITAPLAVSGVTLALFVYRPAVQAGSAEQPALSHLPDDMAFFVVHKPLPVEGDAHQVRHWIGLYLYGE